MGDAPTDPKPLEVPLTGLRRVLCDVDGPDWRVAFYYPAELSDRDARELEKRARTGSKRDVAAREKVRYARGSGRAPSLRDALRGAMTRKRPRPGTPALHTLEPPAEHEVETIARYILDGRYAERLGRAS